MDRNMKKILAFSLFHWNFRYIFEINFEINPSERRYRSENSLSTNKRFFLLRFLNNDSEFSVDIFFLSSRAFSAIAHRLSTMSAVKASDKKVWRIKNKRLCDSRNVQPASLSTFRRQDATGSIACSCDWRKTRLTGLSIFITSESCSSAESRVTIVVPVDSLFCWIHKRKRERISRNLQKLRGKSRLYFNFRSVKRLEPPFGDSISANISDNGKPFVKRRDARFEIARNSIHKYHISRRSNVD